MAFPQVAAVNGGNNPVGSTDHTVNLPAGINAGDLLLVFFASDGDTPITFPGGWAELFRVPGDASVTFGAWYRVASGGEGATINVTTPGSKRTAHTSYRITGYSGTPEVGTAATGTSANPDPPSLTPSWGAKDTLWFASCGYDDGAGTTTVGSYPFNYADGRNDRAADPSGCGIGIARRELYAASENPGTFTLSRSDQWVANTVAVQPLAAGVGGGGAGGVTSAAGILLIGA